MNSGSIPDPLRKAPFLAEIIGIRVTTVFFPSSASPYADGSISLDPYLWQQHLDRLRSERPVQRTEVAETYEELFRQFRWMLRQTKDVMADPALQDRNCQILSSAGERMLDLHRICYRELQRSEEGTEEALVPPAELYQLMEAGQDLTDRIRRQIACMHQICNFAMELREFILILLHQSPHPEDQISFDSLDRLLKRMRLLKQPGSLDTHLHPLPHPAIEKLTAVYGDPFLARSLVMGITTTLDIQRVAGMSWLNEPQLQLAGAAGLLQDCGWFVIRGERHPLRRDIDSQANTHERCRQHPAVGAALIGAMRQAPPQLARIVSQHHERLDGSGYPRQVDHRELTAAARLVSAAVRLEELRLDQDGLEMLLSAGTAANAQPIRQFILETRQGKFERSIAEQLLREYAGSLPLQEWWNEPLQQTSTPLTGLHPPHPTSEVLKHGAEHLLQEQIRRQGIRQESRH